IPARDGEKLVSYLTCPVGVPRKNLPMVLYVHGGPWARDVYGYDPTAQWLANRGYAALQVNFRASTGFGKRFLHLGDKQWGGTMQDDIKAPLLIGQGQNDPRVNVRESDQIAAAMRAKNLPVEYVVYSDEGHGFARPENRMDFYGRAENFLSKHLGGRSEAFVEVKGA